MLWITLVWLCTCCQYTTKSLRKVVCRTVFQFSDTQDESSLYMYRMFFIQILYLLRSLFRSFCFIIRVVIPNADIPKKHNSELSLAWCIMHSSNNLHQVCQPFFSIIKRTSLHRSHWRYYPPYVTSNWRKGQFPLFNNYRTLTANPNQYERWRGLLVLYEHCG